MRPAGLQRCVLLVVLFLILAGLALAPGIAGAETEASQVEKPTVVRELPELRTENSKTYLLSDGARQAVIYSSPIQFKDEKGAWKEIDTSLVPSADGSFVSAATPVKVKLAKKDTGAPVVSLTHNGAAVELVMKDLFFAPPTVEGNTASYTAKDDLETESTEGTTTEAPSTSSTTLPAPTTTEPASTTTQDTSTTTEPAPADLTSTSTEAATPTEPSTSDTTVPAEETTTTEQPASETTTSTSLTDTAEETTTTEVAPPSEVSLTYEVTAGGVKENIILASPAAPNTFSFTIRHPGLILRKDHTGQWGFYDELENPHPVFVLGTLLVFDSNLDELGMPTACPEATMAVTPGEAESEVSILVPASWLADPDRIYPVTIDPSVETRPVASDTFITSGHPTTGYGSCTWSPVGYSGASYYQSTALIQFTLPSALSSGGYVQSAHFQVYQYYKHASGADVARASAMTASWSAASTYSSLGSKSWFGSDTRSISVSSTQTQWLDFDFTQTVQEWVDGSKPNYGFTLYQSAFDADASRNWWRQVYLSEYGTTSLRPKLVITYTPQIDASLSPYSADKTGTNDATEAIEDAINAADAGGGMVYLPAGNYKVNSLTIGRSNLVLRGSGSNTRLVVSSPAQDCTLEIGGSSAVSNVTVKNLYVRMPAGGDGIRLEGTGGGSDITLSILSMGGGADSSEHQAISVASNFDNLSITGNDLSAVTALPWDYSSAATQASISGNSLNYEPYRSDFFGGTDRYETAVRMSKVAFPYGINVSDKAAVVALGTEYPSVLCAGPLATAYSGPLLLNSSATSLDPTVRDELQRLAAPTIFLVGLPDAVYNAVKDNLPACTVTKLIGTSTADYVGTGTAVATQTKTKKGGAVSKVIIVPHDDLNAGLAAVVPLAAKNNWPVLFTPQAGPLPSGTSTWCTTSGNMTTPRSAIEVDTNVNITATFTGGVTKIDEYGFDTAWALAADVSENGVNNCTYAYSGVAPDDCWDAALLGSYLGPNSGRLLLTDSNGDLPPETIAALDYVPLDYLAYANLPGLFATDENPGFWVPGAPRHTAYDLGGFAGHSAEATLDTHTLDLAVTDLEIASLGPRAALDRYYSSARTVTGYFAPGWGFGFERELDLSLETSGRIDYIDERGEVYTFLGKTGTDGGIGLPVQTTWTAQPGFNAALRREPYSYWKLSLPGGNTLTFTGDGRLYSEEDANLNMAQYTWTTGGDPERIYAANGDYIELAVVSDKLTEATYVTSAGSRTVSYSSSAPWTVTYFPEVEGLERTLTYGYEDGQLSGLTANNFTSLGNSTQTFEYGPSGALTAVYYPDHVPVTNADPRVGIAYDDETQSATVTTYGRIYSSQAIAGVAGTAVTQTFTWNTSGTLASKSNPKTGGEDETWEYEYSHLTNYLIKETSPLNRVRSWIYNNRGNLISETDWHDPGTPEELWSTTTWTYPDRDPLVQGFIQASVAYNEDDVYNAGSALRTDRVTQAIGRGSAVDSPGWRFRNLQIPKGAVITQARLYLAAYYPPDGDMTSLSNRFGAEAADNPGVWAAGTHEPRVGYSQLTSDQTVAVSLCPGDENGDPTWIPPNYSQSHDFHTSVQEVVSGAGWAAGNSMCIIAQDAGTPAVNFINCYDSSGGKPAILRIWYGLRLDPDPKWDEPTVKTDPRGHKTYYSYDKRGNLIETRQDTDQNHASATRYTYKDLDSENYGFLRVLKQTQSLVSGSWNNRFSQTSEFDDAAWAKTRSGVFSNVMEGPLGRDVTADKLVENNASGSHAVGQTVSVTSGTTYRVSVYVYASERYQVAISLPSTGFTAATAVFEVAEGASVLSHDCEDADVDYMLEEGWYRIWAEQTATSTTNAAITIGTALDGATSYTGTGHATPRSSDPGIYLWGAECLDVSTPVVVTTNYDTNGYNANGTPKQAQTLGVALGNGQSPNLTVSQVYDDFGLMTSKTNTAGQVVETNEYDIAGRLLTSTGPSLTATPLGCAETSTQLVKHYEYDPWGHVTASWTESTDEPVATKTKANWVTTAYDKAGRPNRVEKWLFIRDPSPSSVLQSTQTLTYDGLGRLIETDDTTVSGLPALTAYDARGNLVASWLEGACTGSYDLVKAARHLNPDNTPAYDSIGRVLRSAPPGDDPTTFTYTDDNRLLREAKPDGTWTEYTYDGNGNVTHTKTAKSDPNFLTTSEYDYANRLTAVTDGNNLTTDYTYDLLGRRITAKVHGGSSSSQFTYNVLGWQLRVEDADTFTTSRVFDSAGKLTEETTASHTSTITYQTGASGLISQKDEQDNHRTVLTYDWFGRTNHEVQTLTSPFATYKDTSFDYDSLGRVLTSTDNMRHLTHSFTYPENTPGNTTDAQEVGSGTHLVSTDLTIGADGLEASRASTITSSPQVPDVTRSVTTRDNAKRVTKATLETGPSCSLHAQYAYDSSGRIQKQWGLDDGQQGVDGSGYLAAAYGTNAYTYDSVSGLKTADNLQLESVGSGENVAGVITSTYTYTANGRLQSATTNGVTEDYEFDPAGGLTDVNSTELTYDENRLETMTTGASTTYYFFDEDKRWRIAEQPTDSVDAQTGQPNDDDRTTYAYTGTGRLASRTEYTGGNISKSVTYTYDAQGQRTRSEVAVTGGLTTTTDFVYEGLLLRSLSATQTGTGAASWKITYLYDEYGKPYAGVYRSPGTSDDPVVFGIVTTDRGDVVELLDVCGQPFAAYRYDAWGNPQNTLQGAGNVGTGIWSQETTYGQTTVVSAAVATEIAKRQVLRYASYCYDTLDPNDTTTVGLYYLSARSYDPKTRQFLSKDLSRNDGEQSAYQYCGGNPVRNVDPTGYYWAPSNTQQNINWVIINQWKHYGKNFAAEQKKASDWIAKRKTSAERVVSIYKQRSGPTGLSRSGGTTLRFPTDGSDFTSVLTNVLVTDAGRVRQEMGVRGAKNAWDDAGMLMWYANQVGTKCVWDFKQAAPDEMDNPYIKFKSVPTGAISPAQFGNLHVGFVGAAAGLSTGKLTDASFFDAMDDWGKEFYPGSERYVDELGDEEWIRRGVDLYNDMYPQGSSGPSLTWDYWAW